jgi:HIP---CoA ligase
VPGVLQSAAKRAPDAPALICDGDVLTYAELLESARRAAESLVVAGVQVDEPVGIWLPNGTEWAIAAYGILFAGARVVPINMRYTVAEVADIVVRSGCRSIVTEVRGGGRGLGPAAPITVPELLGTAFYGAEVERRIGSLSANRIAYVQYTSGTTGRPKGALLSHGGLVETTRSWVRIVGLNAEDRYPVVAPFSHIGGHKTGLLAGAVAGAALLPWPALDPAALTRMVVSQKVTFLQGPPTLYQALLDQPGMPVGQIRVAVTGAAVIPHELVGALRERLGVGAVFTAYGLTEAGGVCTMTRADDAGFAVAHTAGRPIPGVEIRIDACDGPGEILVRSPGLMTGYQDDPEASAAALQDGWLRTGDIGELDALGRLRVVDRIKDMVIVGGLNVYPAEVEQVMAEHPDAGSVAVIGIPHERMGEVPAAFVTGPADHADLSRHCARRLAGFKTPRTIWTVAELPINAAGKVDKPQLREWALDRAQGA